MSLFFCYFQKLFLILMVIHSTFKDFILSLFVHMSRADENYDPYEMATIKKKISGMFEKDADIEQKLYASIRQYNSFDRSKLGELFRDSFKHFGEDQSIQGNSFYNDLTEIMQADGKVVDAEKLALQALKEIVELNCH